VQLTIRNLFSQLVFECCKSDLKQEELQVFAQIINKICRLGGGSAISHAFRKSSVKTLGQALCLLDDSSIDTILQHMFIQSIELKLPTESIIQILVETLSPTSLIPKWKHILYLLGEKYLLLRCTTFPSQIIKIVLPLLKAIDKKGLIDVGYKLIRLWSQAAGMKYFTIVQHSCLC
jgi:hypothetical protein